MTEYKVRVYENRTQWRNQNDEFHRLDGPAIEWASGGREWMINGNRHRLDGPAIEWSDGSKFWYVNGKLHRLDGPAREWADGDREWWIEGERYSEEDFHKKVKEIKHSCEGKIVEVDGKKYQLKKV